MLVFHVPVRGALWLFTVAGASAALAWIGIGVMVATVSKSQQQAQSLTFFVNPPNTLFSGATSPIENMPEISQKNLLFRSLAVPGDDCARRYLKGSALERLVAKSGCSSGVCSRVVFPQRMALRKQ
jgi:ABC-2 type transport system permease protein